MATMNIIHVDDHALFSEALSFMLASEVDSLNVDSLETAEEIFEKVDNSEDFDQHYDLIILDITLKSSNGLSILMGLKARKTLVPVVILSANDDIFTVKRAYDLGAAAFIAKTASKDEMFEIVRYVLDGQIYLPPSLKNQLIQLDDKAYNVYEALKVEYQLSARHVDIMELLHQGLSNGEIATALCRSVSTVKSHIYTIFSAMDISSRVEFIHLVDKKSKGHL